MFTTVMITLVIAAFLIGFVSTLVGAIATGSNLVSIPALIFAGLSPVGAIATTRFSAFAGGTTVVSRYNRAGAVRWRYVRLLAPLAILAGLLGPYLLGLVSPGLVRPIVGVLMLLMLPLLFLNPQLGLKHIGATRPRKLVGVLVIFLDLLYGATFGLGGSVFLLYTLIYFFGLEIIEANGTGSAIWLITAIITAFGFFALGQVNLVLAIPLMLGAVLGGFVGVHLALKHGSKWVRNVLAIVVLLSGLKLLL